MSANAPMIECWNTQSGQAWLQAADAIERMLEPFGLHVQEALAPREGERVLDVGCGGGALALALARAVGAGGAVTGIDISRPLLELAARRAREAGLAQRIEWLEQDAQTAALRSGQHDAVASRFGVMFFADAAAAFANLVRATREGGRLAFVCWQARGANPWFEEAARAAAAHVELPAPARDDEPGPFGLASRGRLERVLREAGWRGLELTPLGDPLCLGADLGAATDLLTTIGPAAAALRQPQLEGGVRERVRAAIQAALAPYAGPQGVLAPSAAWLVSAQR